MPQRTTEFQTIVHFVRQHTAAQSVTVTESKLLPDSQLGVNREVDIVVEGQFDGERVVTSIEVIEHTRKGDLPWVEQQISKHRHLPTNRLVLISRSGFTKSALRAVTAEGGWVEALQPEIVIRDGEPVVKRLYLDEFSFKPTTCRMTALRPDGTSLVVNMTETPDVNVYDRNGEFLDIVYRLAEEVLKLPWLVRRFSESAHNHPERETLRALVAQVPIAECGYYLHDNETNERHLIVAIELTGQFSFAQTELDFNVTQIGDRVFGSGKGRVLGRESVWVGTTDEEKQQTRISWKSLEKDAPISAMPTPDPEGTTHFPHLLDLPAPADWTEDEEVTDGVGHYGVRPEPYEEPAEDGQAPS
jgi:hypothetical protein